MSNIIENYIFVFRNFIFKVYSLRSCPCLDLSCCPVMTGRKMSILAKKGSERRTSVRQNNILINHQYMAISVKLQYAL